jgi:iron complex outermembrane receptor protein
VRLALCRSPAGLAALLALAGSGAVSAQSGADAPAAPATPEPQRIEVKGEAASDTDQRRREPVAKSIYGREELDKYGDVSVTDVLKRLPGINLSGGNPRMRGLGAGYTQILINGEPAPPGFSLENLPPSQVERIEVTKGPTAEHSAQAVAGTINIILRSAPRQRQRELNARIGYTAHRPVGGFHAMLGDRFGDLSVSLPISGYQWAGGSTNDTDRVTRGLDGQPQTLALQSRDRWWGGGMNVGPRLSWKLSDTLTLESQNFLQRNEFNNEGRSLAEVLAGNDPRSLDDRYRNGGHWQQARSSLQLVRRFGDGARLEARVGARASDSAFRTTAVGLDRTGAQAFDRLSTGSTREHARSTSGKFTQPLGESHTLAMGWDAESQRRRETRELIENGQPLLQDFEGEPFQANVKRIAAYVQDEWAISPRWSTYLGLRAESIATTSRSSSDELRARSEVVTPVLHLNYKFDPKSRDLIRASLTRAYKAPDLGALMARPQLNNAYPVNVSNVESGPDRVGNPALQPELSTGLDIAYETYFANGGVMSIGLFHRRIHGLVRNAVTLENVSWAAAPRWVSRPINLEGARSTGLEFEIKGRAGELMPTLGLPADLSLRLSMSAYRSQVDDIPAPDNRLEQQQPWSLTLGFDHRWAGTPLGFGANLAYTPGYVTQQTAATAQALNRVRTLDAYLSWTFSREASFRLSVNNAAPLATRTISQTVEQGGYVLRNDSLRRVNANWNAGLSLKF